MVDKKEVASSDILATPFVYICIMKKEINLHGIYYIIN
nr:MAG TPA: hypothetical protein [Caudoviricetes sp.]